ncbi:hypothetical protein GCK72_010646 [Caenorhabditis remanei]|nr:hypothetical protein GCK72_010646 [Caenorhabditis remanei]KAF1762384.1 hypothetical protein GCK72_010646 [Caenorhabditis remanei]
MTVSQPVKEHSKRRVAYYYDSNIGNYYYGPGHVMKPHRIRMAHELILNYGLYRNLSIYRPTPASFKDITRFHSEEYVNYLKGANLDNVTSFGINNQFSSVLTNDDCPMFDGLYDFCRLSCGGSLAAAVKLNKKKADIAINWMGGLHHAKKSEASGFCYTNDIVIGILELLKHHKRVLYVDIDIHHGDGVEEAFFTTDRVMTVSFHRHGDFFPGTGDITDIGAGKGKLYSVNVPLADGIRDEAYKNLFEKVMDEVMYRFQPEAVVLQCGADSLNQDRLGRFNLTLKGHGNCVSYFRSRGLPLMLVGGGGYTPRNVARCWAYETALAVDMEVSNNIPFNNYYEYFGPDFQLHIDQRPVKDDNIDLDKKIETILDNLKLLNPVPSVERKTSPPDAVVPDEKIVVEYADPDVTLPQELEDSIIQHEGEFFDHEREGDDRRNEHNGRLSAE